MGVYWSLWSDLLVHRIHGRVLNHQAFKRGGQGEGSRTVRFLRYRTAVITGAGSGIGRALAVEMAIHGMHLALVDLDEAV